MTLFNAYVTQVFRYNCKLLTVTKNIENEIVVFQSKLLRNGLKLCYSQTIWNNELHATTKEIDFKDQTFKSKRD